MSNVYGEQFLRIRLKSGKTQAELAALLGYTTPQFISNIERGRCRLPIPKWKPATRHMKTKASVFLDMEIGSTKRLLEKVLKI